MATRFQTLTLFAATGLGAALIACGTTPSASPAELPGATAEAPPTAVPTVTQPTPTFAPQDTVTPEPSPTSLPPNGPADSIGVEFQNDIKRMSSEFRSEGSDLYLPAYVPDDFYLIQTDDGERGESDLLFYRRHGDSPWFYLRQGIPALTKYSLTGLRQIGSEEEPVYFRSMPANHQVIHEDTVIYDEVEPDGNFSVRFLRDGIWFAIEAGNGTCPGGGCLKWSEELFLAITSSLRPYSEFAMTP